MRVQRRLIRSCADWLEALLHRQCLTRCASGRAGHTAMFWALTRLRAMRPKTGKLAALSGSVVLNMRSDCEAIDMLVGQPTRDFQAVLGEEQGR